MLSSHSIGEDKWEKMNGRMSVRDTIYFKLLICGKISMFYVVLGGKRKRIK